VAAPRAARPRLAVVSFRGFWIPTEQRRHYANNFSLPESGAYTLRAEMQSPTFLRHETEEKEGRVLTEPIVVEFENVNISTEGE
jgi:hypothetical protein